MKTKHETSLPKINDGRLKELKKIVKLTNLTVRNLKIEIKNYLSENFDFEEYHNGLEVEKKVSFCSETDATNQVWYLRSTVRALDNFFIEVIDDSIIRLNIPKEWNNTCISGIFFEAIFNDKDQLTESVNLVKNLKIQLKELEKIIGNTQTLTKTYNMLDVFKNLLYYLF